MRCDTSPASSFDLCVGNNHVGWRESIAWHTLTIALRIASIVSPGEVRLTLGANWNLFKESIRVPRAQIARRLLRIKERAGSHFIRRIPAASSRMPPCVKLDAHATNQCQPPAASSLSLFPHTTCARHLVYFHNFLWRFLQFDTRIVLLEFSTTARVAGRRFPAGFPKYRNAATEAS